jgi:hypothetical protein
VVPEPPLLRPVTSGLIVAIVGDLRTRAHERA